MFVQDSRRSYRTYRYSELILKTYLCLFRTPVGVTELILKLRSLYLFGDTRRYHRDYGTYTGIVELILVLRILYWYYGTCTCLTDLILSLFWYKSTRRYYTDSLYKGTRRYHWIYTYRTDTRVLVGTTELVLILPIRKYLWVLQSLYLFY